MLLGLAGFFGVAFSTRLEFNDVFVNFPWSISLPLLVTLAWGPVYGLMGITLGLTAFYPFVLGWYNGWASLVPMLSMYPWVLIHGYGWHYRNHPARRRLPGGIHIFCNCCIAYSGFHFTCFYFRL